MLSLISFSEILTQLNLKPSCLPPVNLCHSHEKLKTSSKNEKTKQNNNNWASWYWSTLPPVQPPQLGVHQTIFLLKSFFGAHIWIKTQNKNVFQHAQSMQEVAPSFLQDIYKHYQFQIILLRLSIGFCSRSPTKNEQIIFFSFSLFKLPTSSDTAKIPANHVFRLYSIPSNKRPTIHLPGLEGLLWSKVKLKGSIRR